MPPHFAQQEVRQVGLTTTGIGPTDHREVGQRGELGEGRPGEQRPTGVCEQVRILRHQHHADAAWIVEIGVDHGFELAVSYGRDHRTGIETVGKDVQLHEQTRVEGLRFAAHSRTMFDQVWHERLHRGWRTTAVGGRSRRSVDLLSHRVGDVLHKRGATILPESASYSVAPEPGWCGFCAGSRRLTPAGSPIADVGSQW